MQVTVIDNKSGESHVCSKSEAARILGVCYKTMLRWSKKGTIEEYNQFNICFKTTVIKQPKGKYPRRKIKIC
jgi:predicted site-specific integrase-resolvase